MTAQERAARRYSRRCRQQRRAKRCKQVAAAVILLALITVFVSPWDKPTQAVVTKTPEVAQTELVQEPTSEPTPEPVRHRDDIISEGRLLAYDLQELMQETCDLYGVPYALALAIAEVETHFDPDAVSAGGDTGLIMYQNDPMKVLTGEVRLSYCNLTTPRAAQQGGEPKYSVTLLIPKTDMATKADIDAAISAAANDALAKVWNGARPPQLRVPIYDGDGVRPSGVPFGDECKGHWVMTASTKNKPQVVGMDNINCELAPSDIYSGMYARVTIRFFGYSNSGNKGIGCGLGNVMKTRDGEALAGSASASVDFAGVGASPATPAYGAAMPATPGAYGAAPVVPAPGAPYTGHAGAVPSTTPPWTGGNGINPITGQPM